jgi:hypothetical protein
MAQSLHLTRGELDQISRPLLSRAVGETQRVLALTGRHPSHLAGLFLVGGSSRMPMVSKMLHEGLGIAPTVLEQPELPVSEGAALAFASPAPVTPPAVVPSPPVSPTGPPSPPITMQAGSLPPVIPGTDETVMLRRNGPEKPEQKRKIHPKWIAVVAVIVVLAIAVPLGWWWLTNPYKQRPFAEELTALGNVTAYASEGDGSVYEVRVWGDRTLFAYTTGSNNRDGQELHVRAFNTDTGEPLWDEDMVFPGNGWDAHQYFVSEELIAFPQEVEVADGTEYHYYFLDWDTGELRNTVTSSDTRAARSGDLLVLAPIGGNAFSVYDDAGEPVTTVELGNVDEGITIAGWDLVGIPDDLGSPSQTANGDGRAWVVTSDNVVHVFDLESSDSITEKELETVDDRYFAWDGLLYVTVDKETGYEFNVYDIEDELKELDSEFVTSDSAPDEMIACGETLVCVREPVPDATDVYTWRIYDADEKEIVQTFDDVEYRYIEPIGDRLMVEYYEGDDLRTQIYDKDFDPIGNLGETFDAIDGGSALAWPGWSGFGTSVGNVIGLGAPRSTPTSRCTPATPPTPAWPASPPKGCRSTRSATSDACQATPP